MIEINGQVSAYCWDEICGNKFLACALYNAFCHIFPDGSMKVQKMLIDEPISRQHLFQTSIVLNDKIIYIPFLSDEYVIYDVKRNSLVRFPIKLPFSLRKYQEVKGKFCGGFAGRGFVYFLGYGVPTIAKMNTATYELQYIIFDQGESVALQENMSFVRDGCVVGDYAFIPQINQPKLIKMNLFNDSIEIITIDGIEGGGGCITFHDGKLYMTGWKENLETLTILNLRTSEIHKICVSNCSGFAPFSKPIIHKNWLYLLPYYSERAYRIDTRDGHKEEYQPINALLKMKAESQELKSFGYRYDGNTLVFQTRPGEIWHRIDLDTGESVSESLELTDKEFMMAYRNEMMICGDNKRMINEGRYSLKDYISCFTIGAKKDR